MTIPTFPNMNGQTYPGTRTPWVDTTRMRAWSGRVFNQPKWAYPLYKYEINISVMSTSLSAVYSATDFQTFIGFWNAVMTTPGQTFLYEDPDDNYASNQLLGVGDGITTNFQALRTVGGFVEPVLAPDSGLDPVDVVRDYGFITDPVDTTYDYGFITDPVDTTYDYGFLYTSHVYVDGLVADYTILLGGVFQIVPAPGVGAVITWSGSFKWICNFDEDTAEFSNFMYQLYELKKLTFTTWRGN